MGKKYKTFKKYNATSATFREITPNNVTTFAGVIVKTLGNCRFTAKLQTNKEITVVLPGSLRKGKRLTTEQMVFIQIESSLSMCNSYILHVYEDDELRALDIEKIIITNAGNIESDIQFTNDDNATEVDIDNV